MEEPGGLQSKGSQRDGHAGSDLSKGSMPYPLQGSCLESPRDGGAWWAAVCGVAQSWTRLKRLSSSSSSNSPFTQITYILLYKLENVSRDGNTRPPDLPPEKRVQIKKQQ